MLHIESQNVEATQGLKFASGSVEDREIKGTATKAEEARISAVIDAIGGRLGQIPAFWQEEIRRELRIHLECLIVAHEELGASRGEAIAAAARQFGDTGQVARRYRRAWAQTAGFESPWHATRVACAVFLPAMAVFLTLGYLLTWIQAVQTGGSWEFPTRTWSIAMFALPAVAGLWTGWRAGVRAPGGVFLTLSMLCAVSGLISGVGMIYNWSVIVDNDYLPLPGLLPMCAFISFLWLPIGCFFAGVPQVLRTARRRMIR